MTEQTKEHVALATKVVAWTLTSLACGAIVGIIMSGCRPPKPPEWAGGALDCGQELVQRCGPGATGPVAACLTSGESEWQSCLVGLIRPVACGAEVVIGCVVKHIGDTSAKSYALNDQDVVSGQTAMRAAEWIQARGYQYK